MSAKEVVIKMFRDWEKKSKRACAVCESPLKEELFSVTYRRTKSNSFKLCWICNARIRRGEFGGRNLEKEVAVPEENQLSLPLASS